MKSKSSFVTSRWVDIIKSNDSKSVCTVIVILTVCDLKISCLAVKCKSGLIRFCQNAVIIHISRCAYIHKICCFQLIWTAVANITICQNWDILCKHLCDIQWWVIIYKQNWKIVQLLNIKLRGLTKCCKLWFIQILCICLYGTVYAIGFCLCAIRIRSSVTNDSLHISANKIACENFISNGFAWVYIDIRWIDINVCPASITDILSIILIAVIVSMNCGEAGRYLWSIILYIR